ncbi:MAG: sugar phosphate isomerase/epimerase [Acidobacteriales bacterium]|nr:sugar phosphate isomerase/epimerase [Terriglobales bacterium]
MRSAILTLLAVSLLPAADFYVLDNCVGRGRLTTAEQAALLKKVGVQGIGSTRPASVAAALQAFEANGVAVRALYTVADISAEGVRIDPEVAPAIQALKGRPTIVLLGVNGKAPEGDKLALDIIDRVHRMAKASGLKVALYPHYGFHIASIDDALRLADKYNSPEVGISFNLCHWLRESGGKEPVENVVRRLRRLQTIVINGADYEGGWDRLIQTLDRGQFDIYRLLHLLKARGLDVPVGLQCYNVPGEPEENLTRSCAAWRAFSERLAAEK